MAARALFVAAIIAAAITLIVARASAARRTADEGMCNPPTTTDTAGWHVVRAQGISLRVPHNFTEEHHRGNWTYLLAGQREIGLGLGEGADEVTMGATTDLIDGCRTMIGGRPVEIRVLQFTVNDRPLAPSGDRGMKYIADARWAAVDSFPTVSAFIFSNDRTDLRRLKGVFYTADVGVKPKPPCAPMKPLPAADSVLDSAAIAMRVGADGKTWPTGSAVLMLRFDAEGALASMGVTGGDLPDSAKHSLAILVGTNVRTRPKGGPSAVQLKVTSAASAFAYEVTDALSCPP